MKTVNVLTYCVPSSYGSVLQALGLKKTLKTLGFDSRVLETEVFPENRPRMKWSGSFTLKKGIRSLIKIVNRRHILKKHANSAAFIKTHMDVMYCRDLTQQTFSEDDIFLAGSDQIWNPQKLYAPFFLDFAPASAKKLSYAASMGALQISEDRTARFGELLSNFDAVSVREAEMTDVLKPFIDKPIEVHIDPTFLVEAEEWRSLARPYPIQEPYVLVYALYWSPSFNEMLKQLHRETGLKIVVISDIPKRIYANQWVLDADPAQFLWLIDHAQMVVSSSFHGVAFSLIFNKKLCALVNPSSPSRIENVLRTLQYRNIPLAELANDTQVDYTVVNQRIREERQRSTAYLAEVLNG